MTGMEHWPAPEIKALYHLSDVNDASGNGNTLTNNNAVTFSLGKFGNAANFGAANTNKYLYVGSNLGITTGSITISCWVKLLAEISSGEWGFVEHGNATNYVLYGISYEYNSGTRRLKFYRRKYGSTTTAAYVTIALGTTDWAKLTLVYDGTNIYPYVNGVIAATPVAASGSGTFNPGSYFVIGSGADLSCASIMADEVVVFNTAETATNIRRRYAFERGMLV